MLQQICEHIHNYFIQEPHTGTWTIADGMISLPFMLEGQRFWIVGSALNDGVYTYHANGITNDDDTAAAGLRAESFNGTICAMAVPPAVIALSEEINGWVANYGAIVNSPYQSESVQGVYSYTKASGGVNSASGGPTWQSTFKAQLDPYRRISL